MHPITEALLAWYDRSARKMPWRGIQNPYGTWVSETMLQQTRVETVLGYYERFMERFPTLQALAEAPEADVLKMWEGLGYYSRARNLHQGAKQVLAEYGGTLPADPDTLLSIRGIGPYTSRAVASIAYQIPVPAVDGNVIRVISRLYGIGENPLDPPVRKRIEDLATALVPADRPGDHNQAMMDLGAVICVPGTPDCSCCPVAAFCRAEKTGDPSVLPKLPRAKPPREIHYDVPILFSGDRVLLYQRKEKMLQGLWCFPLLEGQRTAEQLKEEIERKLRLSPGGLTFLEKARHVFTHQVWLMRLFTARIPPLADAPAGFTFVPLSDLETIPFPTAMKAAKQAAASAGTPGPAPAAGPEPDGL